jgi:hypothetical protein
MAGSKPIEDLDYANHHHDDNDNDDEWSIADNDSQNGVLLLPAYHEVMYADADFRLVGSSAIIEATISRALADGIRCSGGEYYAARK